MDYISREELRQAVYHEAFETDTDLQKWDSGCWIRYKLFENIIEKLPDADVVERKVGKWISSQGLVECGEVQCNQCKTIFYAGDLYDVGETVDGVGQASLPNYCPHCGADMREVNE